jgi:cell division protein FtsW
MGTFLHPELDPQGIGYQINQAFLAIGSGGIFGAGLGHSQQKFQYLPEVNADSIFAVISEEMGFIVTSGVIVLLVFIAMRTLRLAKDAPDTEGRLILTGCMMWFMVQSFFNIGAMVGLLPLTGVPLPFVSHGGTALMMALGALGVMSNVSKYVGERT